MRNVVDLKWAEIVRSQPGVGVGENVLGREGIVVDRDALHGAERAFSEASVVAKMAGAGRHLESGGGRVDAREHAVEVEFHGRAGLVPAVNDVGEFGGGLGAEGRRESGGVSCEEEIVPDTVLGESKQAGIVPLFKTGASGNLVRDFGAEIEFPTAKEDTIPVVFKVSKASR